MLSYRTQVAELQSAVSTNKVDLKNYMLRSIRDNYVSKATRCQQVLEERNKETSGVVEDLSEKLDARDNTIGQLEYEIRMAEEELKQLESFYPAEDEKSEQVPEDPDVAEMRRLDDVIKNATKTPGSRTADVKEAKEGTALSPVATRLASTTTTKDGSTTSADVTRQKQPKNVECPMPLPTAPTKGLWMAKLSKNLVAASIYFDSEEIAWLNEVFTKTFKELALSGADRFKKLDQLLALALEKKLPKELTWDYNRRCEEETREGRIVTGRQIVWLILENLKSSESQTYIVTYENLKDMPWYGDATNKIVEFYYEWVRARQNIAAGITEDTLRDLLHKKMVSSKALTMTLVLINERRTGQPQTLRTQITRLEFLERCLRRYVTIQHEEKVTNDMRLATNRGRRFGKNNNNDNAMPAPDESSKGTGRPKQKVVQRKVVEKGMVMPDQEVNRTTADKSSDGTPTYQNMGRNEALLLFLPKGELPPPKG